MTGITRTRSRPTAIWSNGRSPRTIARRAVPAATRIDHGAIAPKVVEDLLAQAREADAWDFAAHWRRGSRRGWSRDYACCKTATNASARMAASPARQGVDLDDHDNLPGATPSQLSFGPCVQFGRDGARIGLFISK